MTQTYMDMPDGAVTPGGSVIIHGNDRLGACRARQTRAETRGQVQAYLAPILGDCETVLHEVASDPVHVDVLVFAPQSPGGDWTFVTAGMGDLRMTLPDTRDPVRDARCEMALRLPDPWGRQVRSMNASGSEEQDPIFWPISALKWLARFPHAAGTYLGEGHTIPMGAPLAEDIAMDCVLLHAPAWRLNPTTPLIRPDGDHIKFLTFTP
ncbi:MAG: suppressor of fused domain protein, partial [Pseudomonadota bacterium]